MIVVPFSTRWGRSVRKIYQQKGEGLGWGEGLSMATQWERATYTALATTCTSILAVFRVGALYFQDLGVGLCRMNIM